MRVTLEVPVKKSLTDREMREGLALGLYANCTIPLDQAAAMADMRPEEFESLLRKRSVPRHYSRDELPGLHPRRPQACPQLQEVEVV